MNLIVEEMRLKVPWDTFDDLPLKQDGLQCYIAQLTYLFILNGCLFRNNGYLIGFNDVFGLIVKS